MGWDGKEKIGTSFAQRTPLWGTVSPVCLAEGSKGPWEDLRRVFGSSWPREETVGSFVPQLWSSDSRLVVDAQVPGGSAASGLFQADGERKATLEKPTPRARFFPARTRVDVAWEVAWVAAQEAPCCSSLRISKEQKRAESLASPSRGVRGGKKKKKTQNDLVLPASMVRD